MANSVENWAEQIRGGDIRALSRAVSAIENRAPEAEAFADHCLEKARPFLNALYTARRRMATGAVIVLTAWMFLHVMFGANGMVAYKTKRAEFQKLQGQLDQLQKENDQYSQRVKALQTDPKTIEKEAREQLHYAKPGEVIYVDSEPPRPDSSSAKK